MVLYVRFRSFLAVDQLVRIYREVMLTALPIFISPQYKSFSPAHVLHAGLECNICFPHQDCGDAPGAGRHVRAAMG